MSPKGMILACCAAPPGIFQPSFFAEGAMVLTPFPIFGYVRSEDSMFSHWRPPSFVLETGLDPLRLSSY